MILPMIFCLFGKRFLDQSDNQHQHSTAYATSCDAADDAGRITAAACGYSEQPEQLAANATAQNSGNRVAKRAKVVFLYRGACEVSSDCATDELDNQRQ
jgi:hypothetical protein